MKENVAALIFNWITDFLLVGFSLTSLRGRVHDGARGGGVHPVQDRADLHPLHCIQAHSVPDPGGRTENGKGFRKLIFRARVRKSEFGLSHVKT